MTQPLHIDISNLMWPSMISEVILYFMKSLGPHNVSIHIKFDKKKIRIK